MMWNKKLTLMLVPSARGDMRQVDIPVLLIWGSAAAVLVLLVTSFFLSAQFFTDKVTQYEVDKLRSENAQLTEKFEQMRWNLAEVESRYDKLVEKEKLVRAVFDLPEIALDERQLGIGGPISPAVSQMSPAELTAHSTELDVDRLLRLSDYELEKYTEVESALAQVKDRLDHTPSIWPAKGWFSSGFGMRDDPFTGYRRLHKGVDIASRRGTPIIASARGKVSIVRKKKSGLGLQVVIDHGYGFQTLYAHLDKTMVKVGQRVERGDVIALMGNSGHSTGTHLHYEVYRNGKVVNPTTYILNQM